MKKKQPKTILGKQTPSAALSPKSLVVVNGVVVNGDKFDGILTELSDLHHQKALDYGTEGDTYQNFRGSAKMGIKPWKGAFIRLCDKVQRIQKFAKDGKLANESVIDSFNDLAVYAVICRVLFEEKK